MHACTPTTLCHQVVQGSPYPNATPGRLPKPGTPQSPLRPPSPGVRPSSPAALASPLQSLHLDFLSEGARPEERAALEVAAGMLMARVEGPRGQAGSGTATADEVEKLRRAVMLALLDKQVRGRQQSHPLLLQLCLSCTCARHALQVCVLSPSLPSVRS